MLGDSVLGYEGRVELCPPSWIAEENSMTKVEASVRRALTNHEPERLLLRHGGPRPRAQLQL